jgi:hypothetical protein
MASASQTVGEGAVTRPVTVTSNGKTIHQILRAGTYRVPRFQRPYSWDRAVVEDFWQDLTESRPGYFIGSMVVYTQNDDLYGLVDGQQRLTTITILLAAIRNELRALGEDDAGAGVHTLIERRDLSNKDRFVLESETSYPYLQGQIQSLPGAAEVVIAAGAEEKTLQQAFAFLADRVHGLVAGLSRARKLAQLLELRDRVLTLTVVLVEVEDEDNATVIFQTMNSRGKDLETADLVKSHLLGELRADNASFDQARDSWNSILQLFDESGADLSMNRFLLHSWLSRHDYVGEKQLFKQVRGLARGEEAARRHLANLVEDAHLYRTAQEPKYRNWSRGETELRNSLEALMLFRLRQPLPMVLALLRDLDSKTLKPRMVLRGLRVIEHFHFVSTAVTNQPSSGGVSRMYALAARELLVAGTPQEKAEAIKRLDDKLRLRLPSYAEFEASFLELRSSNAYTQQTPLVRYALRRLHIAAGPRGVTPDELDFDALTIEHLVPQGNKRPTGVTPDDVARLGNLLLVTQALNHELADKSFPTKQQILRSKRALPGDDFLVAVQWGSAEIVERTKKLAKRAYEDVWRL